MAWDSVRVLVRLRLQLEERLRKKKKASNDRTLARPYPGKPVSNMCMAGTSICTCSSQKRCSRKPREPQHQRHTIDMTSPSLNFFRHAIIRAHPEQTVSYNLFSQTL